MPREFHWRLEMITASPSWTELEGKTQYVLKNLTWKIGSTWVDAKVSWLLDFHLMAEHEKRSSFIQLNMLVSSSTFSLFFGSNLGSCSIITVEVAKLEIILKICDNWINYIFKIKNLEEKIKKWYYLSRYIWTRHHLMMLFLNYFNNCLGILYILEDWAWLSTLFVLAGHGYFCGHRWWFWLLDHGLIKFVVIKIISIRNNIIQGI